VTSAAPVVIVGASLAGAKLGLALRQQGWNGRIVLVGEETELPYERPQLSKAFLLGGREVSHLHVAPEDRYAAADIELLTGRRVTRISPGTKEVELDDASRLGYSRLALCTGAQARRPDMPGSTLPGVHVLRTVGDAAALRDEVSPATRVVVVGMGLIGSEVAATLCGVAAQVTGVDPFPVPLYRSVPAEVGAMLADLHRAHGVALVHGVSVSRIRGRDRVEGVELADGQLLPADVVVLGLGAAPRTELALDAGIACWTGVLTDELGRTDAPDVYAAGDVAEQYVPHLGAHARVEHWKHAIRQAEAVARTIAGTATTVDVAPWFWSDQYDMHLEGAGWFSPESEQEVDGEIGHAGATGTFLAHSVVAGRIVAATTVGRGRELRALARSIPAGAASPAVTAGAVTARRA